MRSASEFLRQLYQHHLERPEGRLIALSPVPVTFLTSKNQQEWAKKYEIHLNNSGVSGDDEGTQRQPANIFESLYTVKDIRHVEGTEGLMVRLSLHITLSESFVGKPIDWDMKSCQVWCSAVITHQQTSRSEQRRLARAKREAQFPPQLPIPTLQAEQVESEQRRSSRNNPSSERHPPKARTQLAPKPAEVSYGKTVLIWDPSGLERDVKGKLKLLSAQRKFFDTVRENSKN